MRVLLIKSLIFSVMIFGIFISCERHIETRDPVRSLPDAPATPSNLDVVVNSQSVDISWTISDASDVTQYRVYTTTDTTAGFAVKDSTTATSITLSGLTINRVHFFKVSAVTINGIEGTRSATVSANIGVLSIKINSDSRFTNSRNVQIQLLSAGATSHVTLSNDALFTDSVILPFSNQVSFELTNGDGQKTVYARYTFNDGSKSGDLLSDDIILDTRALISSVQFTPVPSFFVTGDTILFTIDAGESEGTASVSFGSQNNYTLFNDGSNGDLVGGDSVFSSYFIIPPAFTLADGVVTGSFTDAAGNTASAVQATQLLTIQSLPTPVQLTLVEALSTFEIELHWTQSTDNGFQSYRIFRDVNPTVDNTSTLVETITNKTMTTFVDTTLNDNTQYYYIVYVRDNFSQDTASNVLSATTMVNTAPTAVTLAGQLDGNGSSASLSWSLNSEDDFESYRIFRDSLSTVSNNSELVGFISSQSTSSFLDFLPTGFDTAFYMVYVYDRHGLFTGSNSVKVVR